jgi:hypothetical protein
MTETTPTDDTPQPLKDLSTGLASSTDVLRQAAAFEHHASFGSDMSLDDFLGPDSAELRSAVERESAASIRHATEIGEAMRSLDRCLAVSLVACTACLAAGVAVGVML